MEINNNQISFNKFMKKIKKDKVIKFDRITVVALPTSSENDELPHGVMINIMPKNKGSNIDQYSIIIERDDFDAPFVITRIMVAGGKEFPELSTTTNKFKLPVLISFISSAIADPGSDISDAIYEFFCLDHRTFNKIKLLDVSSSLLFNLYIQELEEMLDEVQHSYEGKLDIVNTTCRDNDSDVFMSTISLKNNNDIYIAFMITKMYRSDTIEFTKLASVGVHEYGRYMNCYKLILSKTGKRANRLFKRLKKYHVYNEKAIDTIMSTSPAIRIK